MPVKRVNPLKEINELLYTLGSLQPKDYCRQSSIESSIKILTFLGLIVETGRTKPIDFSEPEFLNKREIFFEIIFLHFARNEKIDDAVTGLQELLKISKSIPIMLSDRTKFISLSLDLNFIHDHVFPLLAHLFRKFPESQQRLKEILNTFIEEKEFSNFRSILTEEKREEVELNFQKECALIRLGFTSESLQSQFEKIQREIDLTKRFLLQELSALLPGNRTAKSDFFVQLIVSLREKFMAEEYNNFHEAWLIAKEQDFSTDLNELLSPLEKLIEDSKVAGKLDCNEDQKFPAPTPDEEYLYGLASTLNLKGPDGRIVNTIKDFCHAILKQNSPPMSHLENLFRYFFDSKSMMTFTSEVEPSLPNYWHFLCAQARIKGKPHRNQEPLYQYYDLMREVNRSDYKELKKYEKSIELRAESWIALKQLESFDALVTWLSRLILEMESCRFGIPIEPKEALLVSIQKMVIAYLSKGSSQYFRDHHSVFSTIIAHAAMASLPNETKNYSVHVGGGVVSPSAPTKRVDLSLRELMILTSNTLHTSVGLSENLLGNLFEAPLATIFDKLLKYPPLHFAIDSGDVVSSQRDVKDLIVTKLVTLKLQETGSENTGVSITSAFMECLDALMHFLNHSRKHKDLIGVIGANIKEVMDAIMNHTTGEAQQNAGYCEEYVARFKDFLNNCLISTSNFTPNYDHSAYQFDQPKSGHYSLFACFEKNTADVARIFSDIFCQTYHETSRDNLRFKMRALEIGLYAKADIDFYPADPLQALPKVLTEIVYSLCAEFPGVAPTITLALRQLIKSSIGGAYGKRCHLTQSDLNRIAPLLVAVALDEANNIPPAPLAVYIGSELAAGKSLKDIFNGLHGDLPRTMFQAFHIQKLVTKRRDFFDRRQRTVKEIIGQFESEVCPTAYGSLRFSQKVKTYITFLLDGMELNPMESRLAAIGFEGVIPEEFVCPISQSIMSQPVFFDGLKISTCFDKSTIEGWLKLGNTTHPLTREDVTGKLLTVNKDLADKIEEFVAKQEALAKQAQDVTKVSKLGGFQWRACLFLPASSANSSAGASLGGGGPANDSDNGHSEKPDSCLSRWLGGGGSK